MYKYLFGPVPSRRLGVSLGVDLVTHKICSLDCVYCECGRTTELTLERKEYVPYKEVISELEHYFTTHPAPDYITFSGSGEPTLNSRIGDVIEYIKTCKQYNMPANNAVNKTKQIDRQAQDAENEKIKGSKDDSATRIAVAVLTNGTLLGDKAVRDALLNADLVIPSLDAASLSGFAKINRPHQGIDLDGYIQGLVDFRNVYTGKIALEVLILPEFNDNKSDLELLRQACYKINPDVIQLNTLDRPGTVGGLTPATPDSLEKIKLFLESGLSADRAANSNATCTTCTIPVEIIASPPKRQENRAYRKDMESAILETIYRRPCTSEDLASILSAHINEINKYLSTLELNGQIVSVSQERGVFYHSVK